MKSFNIFGRATVTAKVMLTVAFLCTFCLVGAGVSQANWTPPSGAPPGGNVAAPLNVSSTYQTKLGSLNIGGDYLIVSSGSLLYGAIADHRGIFWTDTADTALPHIDYADGRLYLSPGDDGDTTEVSGDLKIGRLGDIDLGSFSGKLTIDNTLRNKTLTLAVDDDTAGADIKTIGSYLYVNYDSDNHVLIGGPTSPLHLCLNADYDTDPTADPRCIDEWPGGSGDSLWDLNEGISPNVIHPDILGHSVAIGRNTYYDANTALTVKSINNGFGIVLTESSDDANRIFGVYETGAGDGVLYLYNGSGSNTVRLSSNGNSHLAGGDFMVDSDGNIVSIRGIAYSWPTAQGGAGTFLQNNGSGDLTWASSGGVDDKRVKTNNDDLTAAFLSEELSAGAGISLTVYDAGSGNNRLRITNTGGGSDSLWEGLEGTAINPQTSATTRVGIGSAMDAVAALHVYNMEDWGSEITLDAEALDDGKRWQLISTTSVASEGAGNFLIKENTGGVRLTIDGSGNVGIGTTAPDEKLVIKDGHMKVDRDDSAWGKVSLEGVSGGYISFLDDGIEEGYIYTNDNMYIRARLATGDLRLGSGDVDNRVVIDSGGNVGIGDSSPQALLTVSDGDKFRVDSNGNLGRINNVAYSWPTGYNGGDKFLKTDNSGNLSWAEAGGSGTDEKVKVTSSDTTANYLINKLEPGTNISFTELNNGGDLSIRIDATGGGGVDGSGAATRAAFWSASDTISSDSNFYWDNANKRLGIGTAAPDEKLEVRNDSDDTRIRLRTVNEYDTVVNMFQGTTQKGAFGYDDSNNTVTVAYGAMSNSHLNIHSTGNVGIGTSDAQPSQGSLQINKNAGGALGPEIRLRNTADQAGDEAQLSFYDGSGSSGTLRAAINFEIAPGGIGITKFLNSSAEIMRIDSTGNVGIGTTSPDSKLRVESSDFAVLKLKRDGGTGGASVEFINAANFAGWIGVGGDKSMRIATPSTNPAVMITDSGNVGIGHTSPGAKLAIANPTTPYGSHNTISAYNNATSSTSYNAIAGYKEGLDAYGSAVYGELVSGMSCHDSGVCAGVYGSDSNGGTNKWAGFFDGEFKVLNGSVLVEGSTGGTPTSGAGHRLMWVPEKDAFRAGYVNGDQWDDHRIGNFSYAFGHNVEAYGDYSLALGHNASTLNNIAVAIGEDVDSPGWISFAFGKTIVNHGQESVIMGRNNTIWGGDENYIFGNDIVIGEEYDTNRRSLGFGKWVNITHDRSAVVNLQSSGSCDSEGAGRFKICGALYASDKYFSIDHPDPDKPDGTRLIHASVESPTAGDNLYRWTVNVENGEAVIELPDYYHHLNENDMVWVSPKGHFGRAYGEVNQSQRNLIVRADTDGEYNILLIGTRKDKDAVENWDGVETFIKPAE